MKWLYAKMAFAIFLLLSMTIIGLLAITQGF